MLPDLASQRLRLTPAGADHQQELRALNADDVVMRHLTGSPATTEQTDAEWSRRLHERSDPVRGLGYWVGSHGGAFVGWWGLGACGWDATTANLGYRLRRADWGHGLATEGAQTLLRHAFATVGLSSVWAATAPANAASQRVLVKLSMRYTGIEYEHYQYRVTAEEWAQATGVENASAFPQAAT